MWGLHDSGMSDITHEMDSSYGLWHDEVFPSEPILHNLECLVQNSGYFSALAMVLLHAVLYWAIDMISLLWT